VKKGNVIKLKNNVKKFIITVEEYQDSVKKESLEKNDSIGKDDFKELVQLFLFVFTIPFVLFCTICLLELLGIDPR
jgi:hypothetical protein